MNSKKLKILWALDAFDDISEIQQKSATVLRALSRKAAVEITPVYVLSPIELGLTLELSSPWSDVYLPAAKKALEQRLKNVDIPALTEPRVLTQHRASLRGAVESLSDCASTEKYDLIVAGSHGRRGLQRMMLGSFAEELILQSKIPVMILGTHAGNWNPETPEILLPDELTDATSPIFSHAFDFARAFGAKITVLNSIPRPADLVFQSGVYLLGGGWVPTPLFLEKERTRQKKAGELVLELAKRNEVECSLVVDEVTPSVTESILKTVHERKPALIMMAAKSGPIASALIGSITRQIVRSAPCPVLVYRPRKETT